MSLGRGPQPPPTAHGSRGGALPGIVGASLENEVTKALGAMPGVVLWRNPKFRATADNGARILTGIAGKGAPDFLVEVRGPNGLWCALWLECKAGSGERSEDQRRWHEAAKYEGRHVITVRHVNDALQAVADIQAGRCPGASE